MSEHVTDCRERKARESAVGIECEHGYDVCPQCDPCTCPGTLTLTVDGKHVTTVNLGPAPDFPPVPAGVNKG